MVGEHGPCRWEVIQGEGDSGKALLAWAIMTDLPVDVGEKS